MNVKLIEFQLFIWLIIVLLTLVTTGLQAQTAMKDHLVAYYPMDGDARDVSGNCLNGEVIGAQATTGIKGGFLTAMRFDGVDDYIEIPHSEVFNFSEEDDFAISFWYKRDKLQVDLDTTDNDLISKWVIDDKSMDHLESGYPFTFRVTNQKTSLNKFITAQFGGYSEGCEDGTTLGTELSSQDFIHIVLSVDRGKFFLYVNGQLKKRKGTSVFCSSQNNAPLRIGKRGGSEFQNHFTGAIDELMIFNRGLSTAEVGRLFQKEELDLNFNVNSGEMIQVDTLYFDDNVFQLNSTQRTDLAYFHNYLELGVQYHLVVEGHSNGLPDDDFCDKLSLKRAKVVEDYLLALGISCSKITTKGLGKRFQISPNSTPTLRKKNQRTEIKLFKINRA